MVTHEINLKRLDGLSDGIFAIVMTLLVFEIKVPELVMENSYYELWVHLKKQLPALASYVLSFGVLFTYWRAHHFFASIYAKNVDITLSNINAVFFLLVALVPFSSSLLGKYSENELAIGIFGLHTILIGLTLYWMRKYVLYSPHIQNPEISKREIYGSTIRTLAPVVFAIVAIPLSFIDTKFSLALFTLTVIFNLSPWSTHIFLKIFHKEI